MSIMFCWASAPTSDSKILNPSARPQQRLAGDGPDAAIIPSTFRPSFRMAGDVFRATRSDSLPASRSLRCRIPEYDAIPPRFSSAQCRLIAEIIPCPCARMGILSICPYFERPRKWRSVVSVRKYNLFADVITRPGGVSASARPVAAPLAQNLKSVADPQTPAAVRRELLAPLHQPAKERANRSRPQVVTVGKFRLESESRRSFAATPNRAQKRHRLMCELRHNVIRCRGRNSTQERPVRRISSLL